MKHLTNQPEMMTDAFPGSTQVVPATLSLFVFGIYLSTACPTVYMGDSGELTAAAFSLGVAHNSGYPLYVLLGKLFSFLPIGTIAFRLNLMSAVFAALTVRLVFSMIYRITQSMVSAAFGALMLAFAPVFWVQSSCSEVYALHVFFVAILMWLLWQWDLHRTLKWLALLAFTAGLSFGNHTQTIMLAPAVLFIVLSGDPKTLFRPVHFTVLSCLFLFPLALYILLPLRTDAGAALHWGDPNTLERFFAHVTARAHRSNYVFNKDISQYLTRAQDMIGVMVSQFSIMLIPATFGWLVSVSRRWKVFFAITLFCDLFYSVFLNIISLEITPFGLPSYIVIAILIGLGLHRILKILQRFFISKWMRAFVATVVFIFPGIALGFQYELCDQSRNWMAHEHAVNVFRTVKNQGVLFINGDNNIFPVLYSRMVEGARPDVTLYDRADLFFKKPEGISENQILGEDYRNIYYAVFNPATVSVPSGYALISHGILYKVQRNESTVGEGPASASPWPLYVTESMGDRVNLDFMNRQVAAHYHFVFGKHLIATGQKDAGVAQLGLASEVGYNDDTIHVELAVYFTDQMDLNRARIELEKSLLYHDDLSGVYNNWGYFYDKKQEYDNAAVFYRKAIALKPENHIYYNNLGLALFHGGDRKEANTVFQKSLDISPYQPELQAFLTTQKLNGEAF